MRPDSYNETSQVSSSCLGASYEHASACSTQSPKRILPLSYFILQPEKGYKSLYFWLKFWYKAIQKWKKKLNIRWAMVGKIKISEPVDDRWPDFFSWLYQF